MFRSLTTIAVAAAVLSTTAVTALAMETELNMLTGALYNTLERYDVATEGMTALSLAEIVEIRGCTISAESDGEVKRCIEAVMRE